MTRSDHDIFNDHVAVLTRQLGLDLARLDEAERRQLLADAWRRKANDHEAAVAVACAHVQRLLEHDVERARVLLDRVGLLCDQWRERGLVDAALTTAFEQQARRALRSAASE
ncbi:MAG: hypothetical protein ACNA7W_01465 [Pseudomonadales bacterium]